MTGRARVNRVPEGYFRSFTGEIKPIPWRYNRVVDVEAMLRLRDALEHPERLRRWRWWMNFLPSSWEWTR